MRPSVTQFAYNNDLWGEIKNRVANAKRVRAAVAYLGKGGADLLPLKRGSSLVVDMSLGAVRQGVTDPREIRRLMNRGVRVFSRGSLHAKFIIADKTLIAGSANISRNSSEALDEAGVITADRTALRRAEAFFDQLCTEPVRKGYLKEYIKKYRAPNFKAAVERSRPRGKRSRRIVEAKLWFIGGLTRLDLSEDARKSIERLEKQTEKKLKQPEETEVSWIRFGGRPAFLRRIRPGDWIIDCMKDGSRR